MRQPLLWQLVFGRSAEQFTEMPELPDGFFRNLPAPCTQMVYNSIRKKTTVTSDAGLYFVVSCCRIFVLLKIQISKPLKRPVL